MSQSEEAVYKPDLLTSFVGDIIKLIFYGILVQMNPLPERDKQGNHEFVVMVQGESLTNDKLGADKTVKVSLDNTGSLVFEYQHQRVTFPEEVSAIEHLREHFGIPAKAHSKA